jgi:hypothetical protein
VKKLIYLASPYSHPDPAVREARWRVACRAAAQMMRRGELVFSPIAHSHSMCEVGLPGDWAFWREFDQRMIAVCDELRVLMLDGWRESAGVSAEVDIANGLGLIVTFVEPLLNVGGRPPC